MQKLITIYMDDNNKNDRQNNEQLSEYLNKEWNIISITPLGGVRPEGRDHYASTTGWFAVVIEK